MSSLLPCTQCRRHLRAEDVRCPFCGAELAARAVPRWLVTAPKGAKRATLFALGVSLAAAACETNDTPIYGGTFAGGSGGQSGGGNGGSDTGGSATGGSATGGSGGLSGNGGDSAGDGGSGNQQPVYGAPVPPEPDAGPDPIDAAADAAPPADAGDAGANP